jgi:hypothetical protein
MTRGPHIIATEDSSLLGCDAVLSVSHPRSLEFIILISELVVKYSDFTFQVKNCSRGCYFCLKSVNILNGFRCVLVSVLASYVLLIMRTDLVDILEYILSCCFFYNYKNT